MGRLWANFARLGNPMQDCHLRKEPALRSILWSHWRGAHGGGRFRGSARNDNRAAKQPGFREFRRFRGCGIAYGDDYKVSVTGLPLVSPVLHDVEQKAPSLGRSLRYVLYFGVIGEGRMAAGDFGVPLEMIIGPRSSPGSESSEDSEGVVSPTAMIIKSALRDYLLCLQCCMT